MSPIHPSILLASLILCGFLILFTRGEYICSNDNDCDVCDVIGYTCQACVSGMHLLVTTSTGTECSPTASGSAMETYFSDNSATSCCVSSCPIGTSLTSSGNCVICHSSCERCDYGIENSNPENGCTSCTDSNQQIQTASLTKCSTLAECTSGECTDDSCLENSLYGEGKICLPSACEKIAYLSNGDCIPFYLCSQEAACSDCIEYNDLSEKNCYGCSSGKKLLVNNAGEEYCAPYYKTSVSQCCFDSCPSYSEDDGFGNCVYKSCTDALCMKCQGDGSECLVCKDAAGMNFLELASTEVWGDCNLASCAAGKKSENGLYCFTDNQCPEAFEETGAGTCLEKYQCNTDIPENSNERCHGCDQRNILTQVECTECLSGAKLLVHDSTSTVCQPHQFSIEVSQCCYLICPDGYYEDGLYCRPCPEHCIKCNSETECTECEDPYYISIPSTSTDFAGPCVGSCGTNYYTNDPDFCFTDDLCPVGVPFSSSLNYCEFKYDCTSDTTCDGCLTTNLITKSVCSSCSGSNTLCYLEGAVCAPEAQEECCSSSPSSGCPSDYYINLLSTATSIDSTDCTETCDSTHSLVTSTEKYCFTDKKCPKGFYFSESVQMCQTDYDCSTDLGCNGCDTSSSLFKSYCSECHTGFKLLTVSQDYEVCLLGIFGLPVSSCCYSSCLDVPMFDDSTGTKCYWINISTDNKQSEIILGVICSLMGAALIISIIYIFLKKRFVSKAKVAAESSVSSKKILHDLSKDNLNLSNLSIMKENDVPTTMFRSKIFKEETTLPPNRIPTPTIFLSQQGSSPRKTKGKKKKKKKKKKTQIQEQIFLND